MKTKILTLCVLLCCAGCTKMQDTTGNVLDTASDETGATINNLRGLFDIGRKPPEKIQSQPRYCYQTYQDIVCYSRPIAGENYRLVGWQDSNGKAGYTLPDGKVYTHKTVVETVKKPVKDTVQNTTTQTVTVTTPVTTTGTAATSNTVTIQSRNVSTGSTASSGNTGAPAAAKTSTPAASVSTTTTNASKPALKEIIFDPSELEPKQLVPDKQE